LRSLSQWCPAESLLSPLNYWAPFYSACSRRLPLWSAGASLVPPRDFRRSGGEQPRWASPFTEFPGGRLARANQNLGEDAHLGLIRNSRVGSPEFLAVWLPKIQQFNFPSEPARGTLDTTSHSGSKRKLWPQNTGCYLDGHGWSGLGSRKPWQPRPSR